MSPERTDEELMRAYVRGESDAFDEIFGRYSERLYRLIRRQVSSEADSREIVQQTFLQFHRARNDFRDGAKVRPWIFTIALNLKREHFRRRGRRPEAPLELDGRSDPSVPAYDPQVKERAHQLRQALKSLPAPQREVIELHWFEELPMGEIAELLGASVSAVKVRAHRGYARLRQNLAKHEAFREENRNPNPGVGIQGSGPAE